MNEAAFVFSVRMRRHRIEAETDSGTHANMFCATIAKKGSGELRSRYPRKNPVAFSRHLPADIAVFVARFVPDDFHARYDVVYKEYIYKIHGSPLRDPFFHDRAWHIPRAFGTDDIARMNRACISFRQKIFPLSWRRVPESPTRLAPCLRRGVPRFTGFNLL